MPPEEYTEIIKKLQDIKNLLVGTFEKKGMITKVAEHDVWIEKQRREREGFANYAYKVVIMLVLTYIAVKIGMR